MMSVGGYGPLGWFGFTVSITSENTNLHYVGDSLDCLTLFHSKALCLVTCFINVILSSQLY